MVSLYCDCDLIDRHALLIQVLQAMIMLCAPRLALVFLFGIVKFNNGIQVVHNKMLCRQIVLRFK